MSEQLIETLDITGMHIQKNQGTLNREKGTLPEMYKALKEPRHTEQGERYPAWDVQGTLKEPRHTEQGERYS